MAWDEARHEAYETWNTRHGMKRMRRETRLETNQASWHAIQPSVPDLILNVYSRRCRSFFRFLSFFLFFFVFVFVFVFVFFFPLFPFFIIFFVRSRIKRRHPYTYRCYINTIDEPAIAESRMNRFLLQSLFLASAIMHQSVKDVSDVEAQMYTDVPDVRCLQCMQMSQMYTDVSTCINRLISPPIRLFVRHHYPTRS